MTQLQAERYRLVTRSDFDGLVCAALLKELGILDDILFVHPEGRAGRQGRARRRRHHDEPPLSADAASPSTTTARRRRASASPRDNHVIVPDAAVRGPRGLRPLRRRRGVPGHRRADGGRRQGRRRPVHARRDPPPERLGAAQLPDGPAHRPRPLPRVPDLQLPADDAADRRLHGHGVDEILAEPATSPSASTSTARTPRRPWSRSAAARPCTATSWCSTSATRRSSTPRTASCSTRCSRSATSRSTCSGACASRTRCSRPASRSSTAARRPTSAS